MRRVAAHRQEHTGNPALDRMQANVRDLAARTNQMLFALARTHGIGLRRIVLTDEDYKLSPEDAACAFLLFEGTLSADRVLTVPAVTDAEAYGRWIYNFTVGGFNLIVTNPDGYDTAPNGAASFVVVYGTYGPEVWA